MDDIKDLEKQYFDIGSKYDNEIDSLRSSLFN